MVQSDFEMSAPPVVLNVAHREAWVDFGLLLLIALIFGGTAFRSSIAVPGLLLPLLFLKRIDLRFLLVIGAVLTFKVLTSLLVAPGVNYVDYPMDYAWIAREMMTLVLFFAWMLMGQRVLSASRILELGWQVPVLILIILYVIVFLTSGILLIGGIDSLQALILLMYYLLFIGTKSLAIRCGAAVALYLTALSPPDSSFTVIACGTLFAIFALDVFGLSKKTVPWRLAVIAGISVLLVMSLFAYLVNLRPPKANGEGNNGYTRSTLAASGYEQLAQEPILGSQVGRGILPIYAVEMLGWSQYFNGSGEYNIYSLSFHNSFIYLLTRFGLLSLILFGLFIGRVPRAGPIHVVLFTLVLITSAGANVVIESLRSGPGVGFALGALLPFVNENVRGRRTKL